MTFHYLKPGRFTFPRGFFGAVIQCEITRRNIMSVIKKK